MPNHSELYPLDSSERYPAEELGKQYPNWRGDDRMMATSSIPTMVISTVEAAWRTIVRLGGFVFPALAYPDIIDNKQDEIKESLSALQTVQSDSRHSGLR